MGTTLITEDISVDERFAEIVAGIRGTATVSAKLRPYEDPEAHPDADREGDGAGGDREESEGDQRESQGDRE